VAGFPPEEFADGSHCLGRRFRNRHGLRSESDDVQMDTARHFLLVLPRGFVSESPQGPHNSAHRLVTGDRREVVGRSAARTNRGKAVLYYLATALLAVTVAILLCVTIQPGKRTGASDLVGNSTQEFDPVLTQDSIMDIVRSISFPLQFSVDAEYRQSEPSFDLARALLCDDDDDDFSFTPSSPSHSFTSSSSGNSPSDSWPT
jgi:hypothetical protein